MHLSTITCILGIFSTLVTAQVNDITTQRQFSRECGVCLPNATSTCASKTGFTACMDGQPSTIIKKCPLSRPFCTMPLDEFGIPSGACSNVEERSACDESSASRTSTSTIATWPEMSESEPFVCSNYGKYANPLDPTCTTYYYCYAMGGRLAHMKFQCQNNSVFNPLRRRCVLSRSYTCSTF